MEAVKLFKDKEMFFIPHSTTIVEGCINPSFLTMQDTDFGKSLLKFYEGAKLTLMLKIGCHSKLLLPGGWIKPLLKRFEWTPQPSSHLKNSRGSNWLSS